jgi:endonuclease/exonuclease/phosphatase family metal-dependent hydrolase
MPDGRILNLISWNIQWCRGIDGRVDPARIARTARALCEPDLLCFQEVACGFAELPGSAGEDQPALLGREFPGYTAHFAWGVDLPGADGARRRFGNLVLSRLPVQRVRRHSLPWPVHAGVPSMPRVAIEATVQAPWGLVRIATTHLEYYSSLQRAAQVERLCALEAESRAHAAAEPAPGHDAGAPFAALPCPASSILAGDFNMRPEDPLAAELRELWVDAWASAHPHAARPPTFRVHERERGESPYCCDFVLVSRDLAPRVAAVRVDLATQASDHQPLVVEFR